jgi:hypothetical protein
MSQPPKKSEWIFILGNPVHRTEFYKLLFFGFLALSVVVGIGLYFAWGSLFSVRNVETEIAREEAVEAMETKGLDPLETFFQQHFAATRYNEIESLRASGTYSSGEVEMKLAFIAKNPHFYRQTLVYKAAKVEAGYNGKKLWYSQSHEIVDDSDTSLSVLNRALTMLECAIPCLSWEYEKGLEGKQSFEIMDDEVLDGRECFVIKNLGLLDSPVYHYIDKETGLERYRRCTVKIDERRRKDVELFYLPPLEGSEYPLPSGYELIVDGVLYCTAKFDKIDINQGLPNFLFEPK